MEEPNEGHSEVKQFVPASSNVNNASSNANTIPTEPIKNSNPNRSTTFIMMLLILIGTIGTITYLTAFYIPDLNNIVYNQSGIINNTNLTESYNLGFNQGYVFGQEEIIIKINQDAEIPVIYNQSGDVTVNWINLQQICNS